MNRPSMMLLGISLLQIAGAVFAEDVTITTYYPSPRGVYNQLRTIGQTTLAEQGGNVGIGTTAPGATLDVQGTERLSGTLTLLNYTGPPCTTGKLRTLASGQVVCDIDQVDDADNVIGNEVVTVIAGNGLTGGGTGGTVTVDVGSGAGIGVNADAVFLQFPAKSCPPGSAIRSFDVGSASAPACETAGGGGGGTTGSLTVTGLGGSMSPNPWNPGSGANATLNIPGGGGGGTVFSLTAGSGIALAGAGVSGNTWDPNAGQATISSTGGSTFSFGGLFTCGGGGSGCPICVHANPYTGSCSCPSGFSAAFLNDVQAQSSNGGRLMYQCFQ
ncbi:MAG: hypothetical protein HYZ91_07225 [Candidatus Omnitrophica bacterium]|nr:hypothetical protein [Candidatus Omnitrophota bacterium]